MIFSARTATLYSLGLASLLALSACGKSEPPPAAPAAASTAAAIAPAPAHTAAAPAAPAVSGTASQPAAAASTAAPAGVPLHVAKLTLGSAVNAAHAITREGTSFASNEKAIYASVATEGHSDGATLNAKWRYLEGKGQLVSSISQSIATEGPATTTFVVKNPDLWPEGKYQVDISLDGKAVASQEFKIDKR